MIVQTELCILTEWKINVNKINYLILKETFKLNYPTSTKMKELLSAVALLMTISESFSAFQSKNVGIQILDPLEALRFERIGNLKLITETRTLTFQFNLSSLMKNAEKKFKGGLHQIQTLCSENDLSCEADVDRIVENSERRNIELLKIRDVLRTKRDIVSFFKVGKEDQIEADLKNLRQTTVELLEVLIDHKYKFLNLSKILNETIVRVASQDNQTMALKIEMLIANARIEMIQLDEKVKAIYQVMVNKRMDSDLLSVDEFQSHLDKIEATLKGTDKRLPFNNVREYFNKIEAKHFINEETFVVKMEIPIVEKSRRSLFKIHKIPARMDANLFVLDSGWSFLANDSTHISAFLSLELCHETEDDGGVTYHCEPQSPMLSINNDDDCITNAFKNRVIDIEACQSMIRVVKFSHLTFIKISDGQFFFHNEKNENLEVLCRGQHEVMTLPGQTGMISIKQGCTLISRFIKLLVVGRTEELPHWVNDMNVTFDEGKIKKLSNNFKNNLIANAHLYQSINEFIKDTVSIEESIDIKPPEIIFEASVNEWIVLGFIMIMLIVLCFLCCRKVMIRLIECCSCQYSSTKERALSKELLVDWKAFRPQSICE